MDLSILQFILISICVAGAGLITGYEIGKEQGYHAGWAVGFRRGKAVAGVKK